MRKTMLLRRIRTFLSLKVDHRKLFAALGFLVLGNILLFFGLAALERKFEPLILLCAVSEAQNAALNAAGEAIEQAMSETGADYQSILILDRSNDGTVTACRTDTVMINRVRSAVVRKLNAYFDADGADITFPVGNILGGGIFYARGPGISFRVLPIGRIDCDYVSEYAVCGINQTRHQLSLDLTLRVSVLGAGSAEEVEVTGRFPIAETVIVGYVPEHYAGMDIGN